MTWGSSIKELINIDHNSSEKLGSFDPIELVLMLHLTVLLTLFCLLIEVFIC